MKTKPTQLKEYKFFFSFHNVNKVFESQRLQYCAWNARDRKNLCYCSSLKDPN